MASTHKGRNRKALKEFINLPNPNRHTQHTQYSYEVTEDLPEKPKDYLITEFEWGTYKDPLYGYIPVLVQSIHKTHLMVLWVGKNELLNITPSEFIPLGYKPTIKSLIENKKELDTMSHNLRIEKKRQINLVERKYKINIK